MEAMAREWTDDRLDGLSEKVDRGFAEVDRRFDEMGRQVNHRFNEVDLRLGEVGQRFNHVDQQLERTNDRLDSVQRAMIYMMVSITGGILAGFGAILAVITTQL